MCKVLRVLAYHPVRRCYAFPLWIVTTDPDLVVSS